MRDQAFGSQERFQREPSTGELRAMVYAATIAGATGNFFFTREDADAGPAAMVGHVGTAQPRSSSMWSEARRLSLEVNEMAPWLMSGRGRPAVRANVPGVDVGAFAGADGAVLVVASNVLGVPVPAVKITVAVGGAFAAGAAAARDLFGPVFREVEVEVEAEAGGGGGASFSDTIEAMGTRVYLLEPDGKPTPMPVPTKDPLAANLVFNGDVAFATTVGQPDGWSARWGTDASATSMHDASVPSPGSRHSIRLTTPGPPGSGLRAWSYPVKAAMVVGAEYVLSLAARGGEDGQTLTVGFEALWGEAVTPCPGAGVPDGPCSYTPRPLSLQRGAWTRHELTGTCRFQPDRSGYSSAAGMVSIELLSAGAAWVGDVRLTLKNNTVPSSTVAGGGGAK